MKAVDTNVLLRYVLRDDEAQFEKAAAFFSRRSAQDPAFVSLIVLTEFAWTLRQRYRHSRSDIRSLVETLIETAEIAFEDEIYLTNVVAHARHGDLADHLICYSAQRAGCDLTVTFDIEAVRSVPGMELLA